MNLKAFQIRSFMGFRETATCLLAPGFNVVVGQNNAGKSALARALSFRFENRPYRTKSQKRGQRLAESRIDFDVEVSGKELLELLPLQTNRVVIPVYKEKHRNNSQRLLADLVAEGSIVFRCLRTGADSPRKRDDPGWSLGSNMNGGATFSINQLTGEIAPGQYTSEEPNLCNFVANAFVSRVYCFKAERLNIGQRPLDATPVLQPDASNLAQVIARLQLADPARHRHLVQLVNEVIPSVRQVTAPPTGNTGQVELRIWTDDPEDGREDLAKTLDESGSGIGQVLAILYVVVSAVQDQTIIVDEPNSFLHPAAARKLIEILRSEFPRHQYVVTTHSPEIIAAADPSSLALVHWNGEESIIEIADRANLDATRQMFEELGVRLGDLFGSERLLWVEGPSDAIVFRALASALPDLSNLIIEPVIATGDFDRSASADRIAQVYTRLSQGNLLLPPKVRFLFDQEGRTSKQMQELRTISTTRIYFLPRRMLENYLLDSKAIASVLSSLDNQKVTEDIVEEWMKQSDSRPEFNPARIDDLKYANRESWLREVHGGKILKRIFEELTGARIEYRKTEHNRVLAGEVQKLEPSAFDEVKQLLVNIWK